MIVLTKLLKQGRTIEIKDGWLVINPLKGKIPQKYREAILVEIASLVNIELFVYSSYSTGSYGYGFEGVTLQFKYLSLKESPPEKSPFAIFNVSRRRERGSKSAKKGSWLKEGQFTVRKGSLLYKLWDSCGLRHPDSLTRYWERMGNLKKIIFIAEFKKDNKFSNPSIKPANISYNEIKQLVKNNQRNLTHLQRITNAQITHKERIPITHKESAQSPPQQDFKQSQSTCRYKYVKSVTSKQEDKFIPNSIDNRRSLKQKPAEQTVEEWLADYERL